MFKFFSSKSNSNTLACMVISDDRFKIAAVVNEKNLPELTVLSEWKRDNQLSLGDQIKNIAKKSGLEKADWNIVLSSSQYQLLQVDVPDVPEEEINNTLKLKANDLLQYPLSEASISVFRLPDEAYRGRLKMAYIVAAKRELVQNLQDEFGLLGFNLKSIDIADMAMRNLGMLATQKESFAILNLGSETSYINCCFRGYMCLNRQVDVGFNQLMPAPPSSEGGLTVDNLQIHLDSMSLEIQRSLDYFESQLGLGAIPEIVIIAPDEVTSDVMSLIDRAFQARVIRLKPDEHLTVPSDYENNLFTSNCLALGGALRNVGE